MSRRRLDLSNLPWHMGRVPRQPFGPRPTDDRAAVTEWLPADVPGNVRADLSASGRIPPLGSPEGVAASAWVDDYDWWYRVRLPGGYADGEVAVLEADGIDYYSSIWLDGRLSKTHAGMFARQRVVLSPGLNPPGPHELAIRVWGGGALPRLPDPPARRVLRRLINRFNPGMEYFPDRMATPKAQFSFGWDFTPRLLSAGIWDDLRVIIARGAYIEDLWVQVEPLTEHADPTPARWRLRLRMTNWRPGPIRAEITLQPENFSAAGYQFPDQIVQLCPDPVPCTADHEFELNVQVARRWWPWDQGEPCLYRVTVRLLDEHGQLDEISQVVGVRSVVREKFPEGQAWRFVINGRTVFLRGANWVPADVLPGRVTETGYRRLLEQAQAAGINFLRVWGGGLREKQAFWATCNRLGIMAWQEFPLACAFFDHYPRDRVYLAALATEARGIVRALRNHPSLIAWCGGNEINPARERLPLQTIAGVLEQDDPLRPWLPASPAEGDLHQWDVWHGYAPWTDLAHTSAPFMSEFGLQALPNAATITEMFPAAVPTSLTDPRWAKRKAQTAKLRHYAGPDAGGDLTTAIAATQRAQAIALQVGLESCRLRRENLTLPPHPERNAVKSKGERNAVKSKGERNAVKSKGERNKPCGGVAFWQFNEPWPAVSWSVIDHAGRPKAAYAMLQRSFQPVLIAARFSWRHYGPGDLFQAGIWLVNDGPEAWDGCRAEVTLDGRQVWLAEDINLAPGSLLHIGDLALTLSATPGTLALTLVYRGKILANNRYDLAVYLPGRQPLKARLTRWLADFLLKSHHGPTTHYRG